jgi:EAL domain-containing protein (putative c-di-GMP-specific phosphodiesterase class I)
MSEKVVGRPATDKPQKAIAVMQAGPVTLNADDRPQPDQAVLEAELRELFDGTIQPGRHGMAVHYQPILDLVTGATRGFEALIRWQHPLYGTVPASSVIGIAEGTGLIGSLGNWVLDRALRDAVTFGAAGMRSQYVSVNVSAAQLLAPGFTSHIRRQLVAVDIDPARLIMEITETLRLHDDNPIWDDLAKLRELGVRIAIDDYGTGYASLSYLRHPIIDLLKLDQTFLADIDDDRGRAILRSLIALTKRLGIELVAEGIEDETTRSLLVEAGCTLGQGHLFAPAMPLAEVLLWNPDKIAARPALSATSNHPAIPTVAAADSRVGRPVADPESSFSNGSRDSKSDHRPAQLSTADAFVEIADTLVIDFDLDAFLHVFTERCVQLLHVSAAGLLLADGNGVAQVAAASSTPAQLLAEFQVQTGRGPAVDCLRTGKPVTAANLADDQRWSGFTEAAGMVGVAAVHALPMRLRQEVIGSLTLFSVQPQILDASALRVAQALADAATIGLLHQRAVTDRDAVSERLEKALNSRVIMEQAKGIIAERFRIPLDEAFNLLSEAARSSHRRFRDVAEAVINDPGEFPPRKTP